MKIYKTQSEVEKDIKDGVLAIEDDVKFECSISIEANIIAGDITARDINAGNINAWDITAGDIIAGDITAGDITAGNINAWDITAGDITAGDITAGDIIYYAFLLSYNSIKCFSWKAERGKYQEPICLDGKLEIIKPKLKGEKVKVKLSGGEIVEGEIVEN